MDGQIKVVFIKTAGKETDDLQFIQLFFQSGQLIFRFFDKCLIFGGKFQSRAEILKRAFHLAKRRNDIAAGGYCGDGALSGLFVVPEVRSIHLFFQSGKFTFLVADLEKLLNLGQTGFVLIFLLAQFFDRQHFLILSNFHISSRSRWIAPRQEPQAPPALQ